MSDDEFRAHVAARVEALGVSPETVSERAGLSRSFVRQLINGKGNPSRTNLQKLAPALNWSLLDLLGEAAIRQPTRSDGMSEAEASFIAEGDLEEGDVRMARMYTGGRADVMIVNSPSLLLRCFAPGDRILVDMNRAPQPGDAVVVQIYDDAAGTAETVLRIYDPPVLRPASIDERFDVLVLGDNRVKVKAVIVGRYNLDLAGTRPAA